MRKIYSLVLACGLVFMAQSAIAQTVVEDFEGYADTAAMTAAGWGSPGTGYSVLTLETSGGADSSSKYLKVVDPGWGATCTSGNLISIPAAGVYYKVTFWFQNGPTGNPYKAPMNFVVKVDGVEATRSAQLSQHPTPTTPWTQVSTGYFKPLTTGVISLEMSTPSGNGAQANNTFYLDEVVLVQEAPPVTVGLNQSPDVWKSGVEPLSISILGGTEVYTNIKYDIGDNGSFELTGTVAPDYLVSWDTQTDVPTSGSIPVRVVVTDDAGTTGSAINTYFVDNTYGGRQELCLNGDFSDWTGTTPDNWVVNQGVANATWGPGDGRDLATSPSLKITFAEGDVDNRYTLRQDKQNVGGVWHNHQVTYWGKGSGCRIFYWSSADGVTFETTSVAAAQVNNASWTFGIGPVRNTVILGGGYNSIATHMFSAGDHFWDDISWKATLIPPPAGVDDWRMF